MKRSAILVIALIWGTAPLMGFAASKPDARFIYDHKGKRDPFFATVEQVEEVTGPVDTTSPSERIKQLGITVTSIVWDANNPAVLIGDAILEVGHEVKGVIIRAIEKDFVVFEVEGELVEVPIS